MMTIAIIIGLSVLSFFLLGLFAKSLVDAPEQADDRWPLGAILRER